MIAFFNLVVISLGILAAIDSVAASHHEPHGAVIELQTSEDPQPNEEIHKKKLMIAIDVDETDIDEKDGESPKRSVRVIRAGTPGSIDDAMYLDILNDEKLLAHLPDDVKAKIQEALSSNVNTDETVRISEVDVIVSNDGDPHWIMQSDTPRFHGMHREKMRRRPPTPPLSQEAAECVLKTLAKVTTESGTQLLREACAQAYP